MSAITAKGNDAKNNAEKGSVKASDVFLKLDDGDSHLVRILSPEDYVEVQSVSAWDDGIFPQPAADDSPFLIAYNQGGEKFANLAPEKRYMFVFGAVDTGELVAFYASRTQAKNLIAAIEEYRDDLDEFAFNFKRTGTGTETTYSLSLKPKLGAKQKEAFEALADKTVDMEFFETIVEAKTASKDFAVGLLAEIDPSVTELFPDVDLSENGDDVLDAKEQDASEDIDVI